MLVLLGLLSRRNKVITTRYDVVIKRFTSSSSQLKKESITFIGIFMSLSKNFTSVHSCGHSACKEIVPARRKKRHCHLAESDVSTSLSSNGMSSFLLRATANAPWVADLGIPNNTLLDNNVKSTRMRLILTSSCSNQ